MIRPSPSGARGAAGAPKTAHPLLRCLAFYRTMPGRFAAALGLFILVNASLTAYQYLVGKAVHDVEIGRAVERLPGGALSFERAYRWAAILVGIAALRAVLQYAAGVVSLIAGQELLYRLRAAILVQVQRLDLAHHLTHGVGEMVSRTTRDADKVRDALISFWRNVIETGLVILSSLGVLAWYHPALAAVPAALTLLGVWIFVRQADTLVLLDRAVGDAYDAVNQDLVEGVGGIRVIKAFGLEGSRIERFDRAVAAFAGHAVTAIRYSARHIPVPQVVVALGQVWVLSSGAVLVAEGRVNVGELVAAMLATNTLVFRFEGIGRIIQIFADARSSAGRIMELLDTEPAIESGGERLAEGAVGLRLAGVSVVAGEGGESILRSLDLRVAPGEIVAVVGATGSGKSTIAALLPRLLDPTSGRVELGSDAAGWIDARRLALSDLRQRVHVASQDCFLFSDTIAANILMGAPGATPEDLRHALHLASAEDIVERLVEGLETRVGDRGVTLSGGQRQRVALARALIARPSILVLDDSTSALDAVTEQTILHNVRAHAAETRRPMTMLIISSKPSTVMFADRVVVLGEGAVAAEGTHDELARTSGAYRELVGLPHAA